MRLFQLNDEMVSNAAGSTSVPMVSINVFSRQTVISWATDELPG